VISIGTHRAIAQSIQFGFAGQDDKEQVVIEFRLTNGDDPDFGHSISYFGFFTDKTIKRTIESLRYCGWKGDDLAELPVLAETGMLPDEVDLVVDHEEYEGNVRAKVKWVNRPGGGRVELAKPMEPTSLAAFSARMKGSIKAAEAAPRQRGGGAPPAQRNSGTYRQGGPGGFGGGPRGGFGGDNREFVPPVDDDIPF
jgi:hypothetical protein